MDLPPPPAAPPDLSSIANHRWQGRLVQVLKSELQGRYQVATVAIPKNTILFQALPYAASIFENHKKRICARCYKFNPSGSFQLRCTACSDVWYCNVDCELTDASLHRLRCPLFQRVSKHDKDLQPVIRMILCILIRKYLEQQSEKQQTAAGDGDQQSFVDEPNFADLETLISHEDEWTDEEKTMWKKIAQWIIDLLKPTVFWCDWITVPNLCRVVSQIECNCFGIHAAGKETIYGRVLYPRASFFNHSCSPNCETIQQVATPTLHMNFIAARDIAAGEEVTISYINENRPRSARRENLSNDYHFLCICSRCEAEKSLSHVKVTYQKSKNSHALKGAKRKEEKRKQKELQKAKVAQPQSSSSSSVQSASSSDERPNLFEQ